MMKRAYNQVVLLLYGKPIITLAILIVTYGITRVFFTRFNVLDLLAKFMGFFVLLIVYLEPKINEIHIIQPNQTGDGNESYRFLID